MTTQTAQPQNEDALKLHERDLELLRHLYRTRLLSSDQIYALLRTPGAGTKAVERRLRQLYLAKYLDRPIRPGSDTYFVYALGTRGAQLIASEFEDTKAGRLRWEKKNGGLKSHTVEHCLMISRLYTTLTLAIRESKGMELLFWEEGEHTRDAFYTDAQGNLVEGRRPTSTDRRHMINPDAFFGLGVPQEDGTRRGYYFFCEVDRSTMDHERFSRKLTDFWRYNRPGLQGTSAYQKTYPYRYFVVLTVTLSPERRDNLCALAKTADDRKIGSTLFRFACERDWSFEKPRNIFAPLWKTPASQVLTGILT